MKISEEEMESHCLLMLAIVIDVCCNNTSPRKQPQAEFCHYHLIDYYIYIKRYYCGFNGMFGNAVTIIF